MEKKGWRGHNYYGLLIDIDGGEGSGKSFQTTLLVNHLAKRYAVKTGREPGTTQFGETLRKVLQHPDMPDLDYRAETFVFLATRAEYVAKLIKPALEQNKIFVSDRFREATKAYQGYGLGLSLETIDIMNDFATQGIKSDITFILDINHKKGLESITGGEYSEHKDKMESRPDEYHQRVNEGYKKIAQLEPQRIKLVPYIFNGANKMHCMIVTEVEKYIKEYDLDKVLLKAENKS